MTTPDLARLCERLRAERLVDNSFGGGKFIRTNPEGPDAAAAIESLVALSRKNLATMEWTVRRLNEAGRSHAELDEAIAETRTGLEGASDDR